MKKGNLYLIREYSISKVICLDVTNTCYQIKYENGNTTFIEKWKFERQYTILEDVGSNHIPNLIAACVAVEKEIV